MAQIDDILSAKTHVRREVIARRNALPDMVRAAKSARIAASALNRLERHFESEGPDFPVIAAFWPFGSEVDTRPLIHSIIAHHWKLTLPCMIQRNHTAFSDIDDSGQSSAARPRTMMRFLAVDDSLLDEAATRFAAKPAVAHQSDEPWLAQFPPIAITDIDAFIVPLVAFDDTGHRLGYGGGNYDQALRHVAPNVPTIGIAFEEQRIATVPTEPHDIAIPVIYA